MGKKCFFEFLAKHVETIIVLNANRQAYQKDYESHFLSLYFPFGILAYDERFVMVSLMFSAHPWVREGGDASEIPVDISVLSNMRQFVKYSCLKQFALRVKLEYYFLFSLTPLNS